MISLGLYHHCRVTNHSERQMQCAIDRFVCHLGIKADAGDINIVVNTIGEVQIHIAFHCI